jgi:hypothetical protein
MLMAKDDVTKTEKDKRFKPDVSRRSFIAKATIGAGAAATLIGSPKISSAVSDTSDAARPIKIPDEFAQAASAPIKKADFPMTGAEVFARVCKEEGLAALFCCPGNYNIQNAIAMEGIPT